MVHLYQRTAMETELKTCEIECEDCGGKGYDPGSLYEPEPCATCGGSGSEVIEAGDRIAYTDDETGALVTATVLECVGDGWLEVRDDGADDTPWIAPSLIVAKLAEPKPMAVETLTLAEKLVASIAIAKYRKETA
jgi:hypothetical protein